MKKVRDVMNPDVVYFSPEDTVFDVAKTLSERNISGAPVVENGKVVGVISESDIVKFMRTKLKAERPHELPSLSLLVLDIIKTGKKYVDMKKEVRLISSVKVKGLMNKNIVSIEPDASVFDAANLIEKYDINRLPVVEKGRLVGIVARADLIRSLLD
jgi:CBS domain-containing protein